MEQTTVSDSTAPVGNVHDDGYRAFLARVSDRFLSRVDNGRVPLFTTDAADTIWDTYLGSFPPELRQFHNCTACRHFLARYGALVTIDEATGATTSAMWDLDDADEVHTQAIAAMFKLIRRARVTGVFLSSESTWGNPITGPWRHLSVTPPASMRFKLATMTANQAMAEKREDCKNVLRALAEFPAQLLSHAQTILNADALYRSEKVLGPVEWLSNLQKAVPIGRRENIVWRAVATAPPGFCHPRSSMAGTLLADLADGLPFDDVAARFKAKMHPLQYQRPQAAPRAGAIAQAEKLVEQLGLAPSLPRRFCRVDEVEAVWRPAPPPAPPNSGGVFGHLAPRGAMPPKSGDGASRDAHRGRSSRGRFCRTRPRSSCTSMDRSAAIRRCSPRSMPMRHRCSSGTARTRATLPPGTTGTTAPRHRNTAWRPTRITGCSRLR